MPKQILIWVINNNEPWVLLHPLGIADFLFCFRDVYTSLPELFFPEFIDCIFKLSQSRRPRDQ